MSKATLSFKLPEEQEEFDTAHKGGDYKNALYTFSQALRKLYKYGDYPKPQREMLEIIRKEFFEAVGDLLD